VVAANQAYLRAAVPDAAATERDHWALSCVPGTTPGRLSAISIKTMETFVLHEPDEPDGAGSAKAFVIVRRSTLERYSDSGRVLDESLPGLNFEASDYRDPGPNQIRVRGWHHEIMAALGDEYFAAAARELVTPLLASRTMHGRGHSYQLADHVLGRI
jgi:hypothetical protein